MFNRIIIPFGGQDRQTPLFGPTISSFIQRRIKQMIGLGIITTALMLVITLISYNPADPSLNRIANTEPTNFLGFNGSIVSDILFQLFGFSSLFVALIPLLWGIQITMLRDFQNPLRRAGWLIIATLLSSVCFAMIIDGAHAYLPAGWGGSIGVSVINNVGFTAPPASLSGWGVTAVLITLAILTTSASISHDPITQIYSPILKYFEALFSSIVGKISIPFISKTLRAIGLKDNRSTITVIDEEIKTNKTANAANEITISSRFLLAAPKWARSIFTDKKEDKTEEFGELNLDNSQQSNHHPEINLPPSQDASTIILDDQANNSNHPRHDSVNEFADQHNFTTTSSDDTSVDSENNIISQLKHRLSSVLRKNTAALGRSKATENRDKSSTAEEEPELQNISTKFVESENDDKEHLSGSTENHNYQAPKQKPQLNSNSKDNQSSSQHMLPNTVLLQSKPENKQTSHNSTYFTDRSRELEAVLSDFGVRGSIVNEKTGPVVTLHELEPAPGVKSSRVISLADDIARSMSAISARVAVIPGRNAIGIELPNPSRDTVYLRELIESPKFVDSSCHLPMALGSTIGGDAVVADLARMPHLLIAGTTGSGKSVGINAMILSLLYRHKPEDCRLIMIDPKMLELSVYDGIPHLLSPVVTDPKKAVMALKWTVIEMEQRYQKMSKLGVRNIHGYNQRVKEAKANNENLFRSVQTGFDPESGLPTFEEEEMEATAMPFLVVVIDEMADLMVVAGKEIESLVQRLAQMARASGIHLITATQRPSVDVITGTIKANFPTRVSYQVTSKIDSRTILGEQGAEQLLGQGDMLLMVGGGRLTRVHGPFVSDNEVENIVNHLKKQGAPQYAAEISKAMDQNLDDKSALSQSSFSISEDGNDENSLYNQAVSIVLRDKKCSISYVQRRLSIGYNRAARLIEKMEDEGIISAPSHSGKREILVEND